ncbi:MAG TPA: nitrile hydratase subunit alpha, partial [Dehalococcoidia bacterium]|nr:nitrile hydratase subunit alpha [Dehalococcoidia bacterium]
RRPDGTEGMNEGALAALVTRDSMIGVTAPRTPETPSAA